ncbi:MAG: Hsp20/alpha crystallin family protein [Planctomycetota bacterium]|nr:MAG: Hsp20/alpha crystallin family protein [Planctomycetota bacterium]
MLTKPVSRWPLGELARELDRLFADFTPEGLLSYGTQPALNLWEEGNMLVAEAEVPGMKLEDLDISVAGNQLTIKGERKEEVKDAVFHRRERTFTSFTRVVTLPTEVDTDKVEATLRNGVLRITMPKSEAVLPRRIEVKGS